VRADVPASTIVVVERETHSTTVSALDALVAHTPEPRRIVVVDSGGSRTTRQRLERRAAEHDVTLLRSRTLLNANEERNLGLRHVNTEYAVFVDNDSIVPEGWLRGLESCARETGAALVMPAITWGSSGDVSVHYAGGETRIAEDNGVRRIEEHNPPYGRRPDELASLERTETSTVEMHCVLVRTDMLRQIGPFDESLIAGRDHMDLGLRIVAASGSIWLEPIVVVHYVWPKRLTLSDYPFYLARWSGEWGERSYASFNETWRLDDTSIDDVYHRGHRDRRIRRVPWPPGWRGRVARTQFRARLRLDRVVTPLMVRRLDRQRSRATPPRVVHAASWDELGRAGAA
jgi:GT2 family glycosyltransferase